MSNLINEQLDSAAIHTDRSRIENYEKCPRLRYWRYEHDGTGVEPSDERSLRLDARIGTGVHDGIEHALMPASSGMLADYRPLAALSAGIGSGVYMRKIAEDGIDYMNLPEQTRTDVLEGAQIVRALVYAWVMVRLPSLLREGTILAVEREMNVDFEVGERRVRLMTRPDIIWRRNADGATFIRNLKTVREPRGVWREQWALDMQTLTEPLAVDKWLAENIDPRQGAPGAVCSGVIIDGLITGAVLDYPRGSGKFYHNSPLLWAWVRKGDAPFAHDEWCVHPDSLVLKADLSWVRAGALTPGDELIGFDEDVGTQKWPKFRPATVTATTTVRKQSVQVVTDKGDVICSADHLWPARGYAGKGEKWPWSKKHRWVKAGDLKPGETIPFLSKPWEPSTDWQGGYIAGVLDGEGSVTHAVSFGQNEGLLLDVMRDALAAYGFSLRETEYQSRKGSLGKKDFVNATIRGTVEGMRALGMFRPPRLLSRSLRLWNGKSITGRGRDVAKVLRVMPLEVLTLSGIETSTGTMIVNGLASHNSAKYEWSCQGPHKMGNGRRCEGGKVHKLAGARKESTAGYPGGLIGWIDHLLEEDVSAVQDQIVELPPIMRSPYAIERWKRQTLAREVRIHEDSKLMQILDMSTIDAPTEPGDPATFDQTLDFKFPMHTASGNCLRPGACMAFALCHGTAAADPYAANYRARTPHHPQEGGQEATEK